MALAKEQKYGEAAAHYQAALQVNPESAAAENNLGLLLQREGHFDEAVAHYTAAVKDDPARSEAHNNLGVLLLQRGRLSEGIGQLQEALRLNPTNIEAQCNIAMALNQEEKWQQAADLFATICPKRPGDPNLDYQFGLALYHLNRVREARSRLAAALLIQQNFPEALNLLAWILATEPHAELRNGTEAVRMAEYACQMTGRKDPVKLRTLAAAYAETGRFPEAVSTAQAALDLCTGVGREVLREEYRRMLDRFQAAQPWRSEAK
jgi:tetratricopeptide (TPR) repeat protein